MTTGRCKEEDKGEKEGEREQGGREKGREEEIEIGRESPKREQDNPKRQRASSSKRERVSAPKHSSTWQSVHGLTTALATQTRASEAAAYSWHQPRRTVPNRLGVLVARNCLWHECYLLQGSIVLMLIQITISGKRTDTDSREHL
jgi:hypothetical protein